MSSQGLDLVQDVGEDRRRPNRFRAIVVIRQGLQASRPVAVHAIQYYLAKGRLGRRRRSAGRVAQRVPHGGDLAVREVQPAVAGATETEPIDVPLVERQRYEVGERR